MRLRLHSDDTDPERRFFGTINYTTEANPVPELLCPCGKLREVSLATTGQYVEACPECGRAGRFSTARRGTRIDVMVYYDREPKPREPKPVSGVLGEVIGVATKGLDELRESLKQQATANGAPGWGCCAFSEDMRHRYTLARTFDSLFTRRVLWVMLNPSTADDNTLDPTVRRVRDFSLRFGFGSFAVANLFSLRSTDPKGIREAGSEGDPENLIWIAELASKADVVVAAWGVHGSWRGRDAVVEKLLIDFGKAPLCLGVTKAGHPRHPLYVDGGAPLIELSVERESGKP